MASRKTATNPKKVVEAWTPAAPSGDAWTARPWVDPSVRVTEGRLARKRVPRSNHAAFETSPGRDPIGILMRQESDRIQELVPLRHARMAESPFSFYRGTPAVMAFDLATTPRTGIIVQASGDAHLSNFGLFASPEREIVFDANDFDETLPAPWEWDLKRLAASVVIAGRANGFSGAKNRIATMTAVRSYRHWMARYSSMRLIDVWYADITEPDLLAAMEVFLARTGVSRSRRSVAYRVFSRARKRDTLRAASRLTTVVDGRHVINDDPPVVEHVDVAGGNEAMRTFFENYRATLSATGLTMSRSRLLVLAALARAPS
jgi:Uncharacterized protein conserved in bacteria (DUF2252)